ncbi:hypothetical protein V8B97DRAFT_2025894 [Scleroderma yunnanense]
MDHFLLAHQPFVDDFNLSHEEVNAIEKQEWDEEEQELILCKEWKKNHTKFLPFANTQISATPPVLPSPLTLWKLWKGEYLAKAKYSIVEDKDLFCAQIDEATHCILLDDKHTESHLCFWLAIGVHECCHNPDKKRWHDTLGTPYSFNLKYLNNKLLSKIRSDHTHKAHTAAVVQAKEQRTGLTLMDTSPSCHSPNTYKCSASPLVDQLDPPHKCNKSFQAQDKYTNKADPSQPVWSLITKSTGQCLCVRWKCKDSCSDKHIHAHLCSGCRSSFHSTHQCS